MRQSGPVVLVLSLGLGLLAPVSLARAQEEAAPAQKEAAAEGAPAPRFQLGVAFLPVLLGKVATGPSNANTSSDLDFAYGIGLTFSYRVLAGLSVGIAPQALFHLTSKDSAGYGVIDSEKEYDLMGRLAYAHTVARGIDVYAEIMSGYSFVTYNKVILGSQAPRARGSVAAGGVGATFALTGHLFANASLGYQAGFQTSHGMSEKDVMTRFVRLAMGAGVRF